MSGGISPAVSLPPFQQPTHPERVEPIVPVIGYRSHDLTGIPPGRDGSGGLAVFPPCERPRAEAEALEGSQQVEAAVLGFGFRMNDPRQLVGE